MRCLKIITLLCLSASFSTLSAMDGTELEPTEKSHILARLPNISDSWNERRDIYFQIGGKPLVDQFDALLIILLTDKKRINEFKYNDLCDCCRITYPAELLSIEQQILEQIKQLATDLVHNIFIEKLSPDAIESFFSSFEDLNDEFDTNPNYTEELHALYLEYLSER